MVSGRSVGWWVSSGIGGRFRGVPVVAVGVGASAVGEEGELAILGWVNWEVGVDCRTYGYMSRVCLFGLRY